MTPNYDYGCSVHDPDQEGTASEYLKIRPCADAQRVSAVGKTYYNFPQEGGFNVHFLKKKINRQKTYKIKNPQI